MMSLNRDYFDCILNSFIKCVLKYVLLPYKIVGVFSSSEKLIALKESAHEVVLKVNGNLISNYLDDNEKQKMVLKERCKKIKEVRQKVKEGIKKKERKEEKEDAKEVGKYGVKEKVKEEVNDKMKDEVKAILNN